MSTKHIFNSADGLVLKSLRGAVALNPSLKLHSPSKSVYIAHGSPHAYVAVISGGGAGHEPAHAGYTGLGMLAASVSGDIFASPSTKQILQTIHLASSSGTTISETLVRRKGVLVIINNYTGDRLNFGLAIEKALASHIQIESVVVADDVSLLNPSTAIDAEIQTRRSLVGARGLAGNILVCKILGAFAERGESLLRLKCLGDAVVKNLASVGIGLEHCHVPGRGPGQNEYIRMLEEECEIGLGLHNEPGVTRKKMEGVEAVVRDMLGLIMRSKDDRGTEFLRTSTESLGGQNVDEAILFVNNLGGMSQLEMSAVLDEIIQQLAQVKIRPIRIYSSAYMTSLNAPGFSISLLNVSGVQQELQSHPNWGGTLINIPDLLDDPTEAVAWVGARHHWSSGKPSIDHEQSFVSSNTQLPRTTSSEAAPHPGHFHFLASEQKVLENSIRSACLSVLRVERDLTDFDTILGDGDCGDTFASGAKAVLAYLGSGNADITKIGPGELVGKLGEILEDTMGGTIGALFAIVFTAFAAALQDLSGPPTTLSWANALKAGLNALNKHTPAQPGDRTLVDALSPFCSTLLSGQTFGDAVQAARDGAERTRSMQAVLGRAAYVSRDVQGGADLPPDPGAWGIVAIVEGLYQGVTLHE